MVFMSLYHVGSDVYGGDELTFPADVGSVLATRVPTHRSFKISRPELLLTVITPSRGTSGTILLYA